MTPKQEAFVREYLIDLNASAAYRRAGYSSGNADVLGPRLLGNDGIQAAVSQAVAARSKRTEVTADRVLQELARIAFLDVAQLLNDDGSIRRIQDMPEDARRALAGLEVVEIGGGEGLALAKKAKLGDKTRALELLGKHLGMFRDTSGEGDAPLPTKVIVEVVDGRRTA